jgi:hypothetical protein
MSSRFCAVAPRRSFAVNQYVTTTTGRKTTNAAEMNDMSGDSPVA